MGRTSDAKERLMQAALDLMWEESYGAVTIDHICQRAEVKKGSFYYFFESKSDLAVAALEHFWQTEWKPKLDTIFSPSREPLQRIVALLEQVYQDQAKEKAETGKVLGCPIFCVGSEVSTQDERLSGKIREILARKRRYYESAIRDAAAEGSIPPCDPAQKVLCLTGLIEGSISQARIMNEPEALRGLPQMAIDLLRAQATASVSS